MQLDTVISQVTALLEQCSPERAERLTGEFPQLHLAASGDVHRAAWHEAAHGVLITRSHLRLRSCLIRSDGTGLTEYVEDDVDAVTTTTVLLAGVTAELFLGWSRISMAFGDDLRSASDIVMAAGLSPRTAAIVTACSVQSAWPSIERVAACLLAVGELSGAEVRALSGAPQ